MQRILREVSLLPAVRTYIQLEIYQLKTFVEREGVKMSKNKCSSLMYAPLLVDFRVGIEVDIKT